MQTVVAALNNPNGRDALFTPAADGRLALEGLLAAPVVLSWRVAEAPPLTAPVSGSVAVIISSEPMGEAQIVGAARTATPIADGRAASFGPGGLPRTGGKTPRLTSRSIRFVTPDVALVDATVENPAQGFANWQPVGGDPPRRPASTDVVLVIVKDAGNWRVAAARLAK